jgi:hypothetical protein
MISSIWNCLNRLNQPIPGFFGNFLKLIYLSSNNFLHINPIQLRKSVHLSQLDLSHNFLSGEIPPQLSSLYSLETLNLSHNNPSVLFQAVFDKCGVYRYIPQRVARFHSWQQSLSKSFRRSITDEKRCSRSATIQAFHEAQRQVKKGPCNLVSTHIPPSFCSIFTSLFLLSSLLFTQMKELYTNILDVEDTIQMKNYTPIY